MPEDWPADADPKLFLFMWVPGTPEALPLVLSKPAANMFWDWVFSTLQSGKVFGESRALAVEQLDLPSGREAVRIMAKDGEGKIILMGRDEVELVHNALANILFGN